MSAATVEVTDAPLPKTAGKKKLIIIIAAAVLVLLLGGGAAVYMLKKRAAAADAEAEEGAEVPVAVAEPVHKEESRKPPIFVPLDPFTVNLADRDAERYAQVGVTLEIEDPKVGEDLKLYLPAIRNNILMLLAHKTAGELLTREGKLRLAREIRRESMLPLGFSLPDEEEDTRVAPGAKKKKKKPPVVYPVKAVHFSNIIIQ